MRSSISCSHRYDRFYDSDSAVSECSDVGDCGGFADYRGLLDGEIYYWKIERYLFTTSEVRNFCNKIWVMIRSCPANMTGSAKRVFVCTGWKPHELEAAKIIEKEFLRAKDSKCPYTIKDISIDGGTIDLTVGSGTLCSPVAMLRSEFFTKNRFSAVNLKSTEGNSEVYIERTSYESFNHVVIKGSFVVFRQAQIDAGNMKTAVVSADAEGTVKVTDIEKVRETYLRCQMYGTNILISGVSLFEMLYGGNWKRDRDGMYVTNVSYYSIDPGPSVESLIVQNEKPLKEASTLKTGCTALELEAAKIIEKKFLCTKDGKCPLRDISINDKTVKLTVGVGALCSPIAMLKSEFFTKNRLSAVNFKFAASGSEISIEKTSYRSFNYVVTKGSVIVSRHNSTRTKRGVRPTVIADADGSVRVTDIKEVRKRYQTYGVNVFISGISLLEMLRNGNWKKDRDGVYVANVRDYSITSCPSVKSLIVQTENPSKKAFTFNTGWNPLELEAAKIIEKKFLRTTNSKRFYGIEDIRICGGTVALTVGEGAFYDPLEMLQSEFFTRNRLSSISFKFTDSGSELSVEKTYSKSFNYVVTKGSVMISGERARGGCATFIVDADGAVRVTDIGKVRERYQRYKMSGINILISGVSVFEMLYNGSKNSDGVYVTDVSNYGGAAPRTSLDVSDCKRGGGGLQHVSKSKDCGAGCEALGFGAISSPTIESVDLIRGGDGIFMSACKRQAALWEEEMGPPLL